MYAFSLLRSMARIWYWHGLTRPNMMLCTRVISSPCLLGNCPLPSLNEHLHSQSPAETLFPIRNVEVVIFRTKNFGIRTIASCRDLSLGDHLGGLFIGNLYCTMAISDKSSKEYRQKDCIPQEDEQSLVSADANRGNHSLYNVDGGTGTTLYRHARHCFVGVFGDTVP